VVQTHSRATRFATRKLAHPELLCLAPAAPPPQPPPTHGPPPKVYHDMLSGGALGSLVLGMAAAALWRHGLPRAPPLSLGPAPDFADELDASIETVWVS
jgi:hypothetical protein